MRPATARITYDLPACLLSGLADASYSNSEALLGKNAAAFRPFCFLSTHCERYLVHADEFQPTAKAFVLLIPPERYGIVAVIAMGLARIDGPSCNLEVANVQ